MAKRNVKRVEATPRPEPTALDRIAYARNSVQFHLDHELERCRETKQSFLAAAQKNDPADLDLGYLIKRYAEDVFLASVKEREVLGLMAAYDKTIDAQDGGVAVVLDLLQKAKAEEEARLLESPYRHNSTCAVSNFHQECELRAKADFWHGGGFNRSTVGAVLMYLEEWLAAEKEVLDAYRAYSR